MKWRAWQPTTRSHHIIPLSPICPQSSPPRPHGRTPLQPRSSRHPVSPSSSPRLLNFPSFTSPPLFPRGPLPHHLHTGSPRILCWADHRSHYPHQPILCGTNLASLTGFSISLAQLRNVQSRTRPVVRDSPFFRRNTPTTWMGSSAPPR